MTIGVNQTYYTNPQSSLFDTNYVSYSRRPEAVELSPIAVTARFSPTLAFDTTARVEYDVSGNGLQIFHRRHDERRAHVGQHQLQPAAPEPAFDVSSYVSGSTSVRLRDGRVTGLYALSWDVARGYIVSQTMAWSYMAQCCGVQFEFQPCRAYRRAADRQDTRGVARQALTARAA